MCPADEQRKPWDRKIYICQGKIVKKLANLWRNLPGKFHSSRLMHCFKYRTSFSRKMLINCSYGLPFFVAIFFKNTPLSDKQDGRKPMKTKTISKSKNETILRQNFIFIIQCNSFSVDEQATVFAVCTEYSILSSPVCFVQSMTEEVSYR